MARNAPERTQEYIAAARLLRGITDGAISRHEYRTGWPVGSDATLNTARGAAESWFASLDARQHDPDLDVAIRADIGAIIQPLETGGRLPLRLTLPFYLALMRDHAIGIFAILMSVGVVLTVVYLVATAR